MTTYYILEIKKEPNLIYLFKDKETLNEAILYTTTLSLPLQTGEIDLIENLSDYTETIKQEYIFKEYND